MSTCCCGIVGMGETSRDRASLLHQLASLPSHPDSLPVNALVPMAGTPLGGRLPFDRLMRTDPFFEISHANQVQLLTIPN